MNVIELARLVAAMRKEQKDFFINHSRLALERAKQYERQVDVAVLQILNSLPQQQGLFEEALNENVSHS
jgi:phosphate uptake regulator